MVVKPLSEAPERTHEAILLHLKRQGEMTVAGLCAALGITSMAVRRHLAGLQNDGLVESRMEKQSRGRPIYKYRLAEKADSLFPSGFATLASDILDTVFDAGGHKGVMKLLSKRNERLLKKLLPRMENKDLAGKVEEVSRIFSEGGYMTEWEKVGEDSYIIFQRHCAVHDLANQYRQLCVLEPQLIEKLVGVPVVRQQYMLRNDPVCGYLVGGPAAQMPLNSQ